METKGMGRGIRLVLVMVVFSLVLVIAGGVALFATLRKPKVILTSLTTPYQAVLLASGQAYFGKLEGWGTPYPVLRDVFYVQGKQSSDTKEPTNVLIKRGKEWHAPDHMILNANMIVLVEPVNPDSQLARLILQAK